MIGYIFYLDNATRGCLTDGVWATLTNYTTCAELPGPPDTVDVEISITVYLVGNIHHIISCKFNLFQN